MALPLFVTFLVLFHVVPYLPAQEYEHSNSTCPMNFECGNLGPIEFPFVNFSEPHCGLCMVDCDAQPSPTIKLSRSSEQVFDVISMSQGKTIKLFDPFLHQLLNPNPNCSLFMYNMHLPYSPSILFTIKSNVTLFRCRKDPSLRRNVQNYFEEKQYRKYEACGEFDLYYRNPKYYGFDSDLSPPECPSVCLPMHSWENVTEDTELFQLFTDDFDLEWQLTESCRDCHIRGGQCETDPVNFQFRCANATLLAQRKKKLSIILVTAAPVGGVAMLVILVFCFKRRFLFCNSMDFWRSKTEDRNIENFLKNYGSLAPKRYHYSDVRKMTNSFDKQLGQGGYGSVYRGKLKDGSLAAVKILKESKGNGEEFINEVASISRTSHVNIVTLLGFCFQGRKKALIYEFMPNGSLEKFIHGGNSFANRQLEWPTLYKIAVGIARGLEYLHRGCNTRILHFDIKPHNILLDEDFCPKISDFGLAKLCTRKGSIVSTMAARGTIGYIAPEVVCKNFGGVSHKSDVYSYGMMVLEMVGGRKNVDVGVDHRSEIYFPHWIYTRLDQGEELGLSGIMDEDENKQARKMLIVSLWCIQAHPSNRPTITSVLEMLEGPLEALQMPPKPFFFSPSRASSEGSTSFMT